jgi:hypothetical protein
VAPLAGVQPGPATREPTATTSAVKTEMSRAEQSSAMPMPGQANDHSIPTPAASAAKP